MSKKFNKEDIEFVLDKINGWEGDLTWVSLCDSVEEHFGKKPTRQALSRHTVIAYAYQQKKKSKGETVKHIKSPQSLAYASNKINKLEYENARLLNENNRLLVMVRDLQMVAYSKGLREDQIFSQNKN
ncbi:TPA: hypothetical protein KUN15_000451 [Escherichia coli]|uniref:hypothetical protein n=1 Tax=Enterobacter hormaechei TaxID=158836 RepID=UPI001B9036F7|nr:hypothetical protein [Escherichia coli]ELS1442930.1 hypothetical protein [Salmonella enterica]HBC6113665.1 hypothetical protein [Citrobacter freundii]HCU0768620.1 hypothetical protein [Klebsiella michiganensis]HDS6854263.1 hypothetical protein [Enterobacter asburiae]